MIRLLKHSAAMLAATALLAVGAQAASGNSVDILKYIPADTPYVLASTEPMPPKLADKLSPTIEEILLSYQEIARAFIAMHEAKEAEDQAEDEQDEGEAVSAEDQERFDALAEEFISLLSQEAFEDAGISRKSAYAFYGNGLLPVLRLELSKTESFNATIERIEAKAGASMSIGEVKGKAYRYVGDDAMRLVVAVLDDQAVITLVPSSYDESQVARALGVTKPRRSLKKSKTLRSISKEYGFSEYMIGYVDNERLSRILTGNGTEFDKELFLAKGWTAPELDAVCSAEIMAVVGIAPRIVLGYSELSTQRIDSHMIIELREDIAAGLSTIPAVVPGLGTDPGGLGSFGMGLDVLALRTFVENRLDAMESDPYECPALVVLEMGAAKARQSLAQPLPPVAYNFKGFFANLEDYECETLACNEPPKSVAASFLVAVEKAEDLLMMASMMDPEVAALNLSANSEAVRIEKPWLEKMARDAYAAMAENAVSLAIGSLAEARAVDALQMESAEPPPFISVSADTARYYKFMSDATTEMLKENKTAAPGERELQSAFRDIMLLSGGLFDREYLDVRMTKRGIEIGVSMSMVDK